jgi:transglutaminase-like putative cysteine protease
VTGNRVELRDSAAAPPEPAGDLAPYLRPELFLESDAPEIVAEAKKAAEGLDPGRSLAEKLVRHVNALLEKKPTVSLPSAAEVLRTGVGDCNEHTVLYVAMARALGIPSRIAVGLVYLHGGFYYHAWPEVFVKEGADRGRWIAVDPTLNQFPADVTHVRIARGGLDKQAVILTSIGQARMRIVDLDVRAGFTPVLVGRPTQDLRPPQIDLPRRQTGGACWSQPAS